MYHIHALSIISVDEYLHSNNIEIIKKLQNQRNSQNMTSSQWSFPRDLALLAVLFLKKDPPRDLLEVFSFSGFCEEAIFSALKEEIHKSKSSIGLAYK